MSPSKSEGITKIGLVMLALLRYRVAVMLWMFFLLGVAWHGQLTSFRWQYLVAAIALAFGYISATAVNDIADESIDKINHPNSTGRPLVNGIANVEQVWVVYWLSVTAALAVALVLGLLPALIILVFVLIGWVYSAEPFKLSYKTYLAPVVLSIAYVALPYALAIYSIGDVLDGHDVALLLGLLTLFLARINLKDFRDRAGDAKYGKPTLLLRFGKATTCHVSMAALVVANLLLIISLQPVWWLGLFIEMFVVLIMLQLLKLGSVKAHQQEQVAIGTAAKMGNGLLLMLLGYFALTSLSASMASQLLFMASVSGLYLITYFVIAANPSEAVIGYRG